LGRRLRRQMDETLDAEQSAAHSADRALVWADDGRCYRGTVLAVGVDHAELSGEEGRRVVAFAHVVALEVAR